MIKQRRFRFRIRKCQRIRRIAPAQFNDQAMMIEPMCCSADGRTEMKQHSVNHQYADEHNFYLEKEGELPQVHHLYASEQLHEEQDKEFDENEHYALPILSNTENLQIGEKENKQNCEQQRENQKIISEEEKGNKFQEKQEIKGPCEVTAPLQEQKLDIQTTFQQLSEETLPISQQINFVSQFSKNLKSHTISLNETSTMATQSGSYWQNKKLILTQPIKGRSRAVFRVQNLKYCVGMGIALKEVIQKHDFDYKSYENELSHGLFLVTSQGYSWSHAYKAEDDAFRPEFKKMKNKDKIVVQLENDCINFAFKQTRFSLSVPESVLQKYTLCFCAYLHEKSDSVSLQVDGSF